MLRFGIGRRTSRMTSVPGWILSGASTDLDFADSIYYDGSGGTLSSMISTTRASTGYAQTSAGVLVPFASNVPRITDQGLLVEEARTNVAIWSQDFSNAAWTLTGSSVTLAAQTAPDGTLTGNKLAETAVTSGHNVGKTGNITVSAGSYVLTVYAKAAERAFIALYEGVLGQGKFFNLSNGTVGGNLVAPPAGAAISALGNGWYRCSITLTVSGTTAVPLVYLSTDGTAFSYAGVAGSGAYIWGLQLEAGSFQTSYVPTTTVAVTRAADVITLTGAALAATQGANGWVLAQTNTLVNGTGTYSPYIVAGDNVNNNTFVRVNTATTSYSKFANTVLNSTLGSGAYNTGRVKTGVTWSVAGRSLVANNGTVATDASAPTSPTTVYLGSANGTVLSNGLIERITIGTTRLPDATIKALTA